MKAQLRGASGMVTGLTLIVIIGWASLMASAQNKVEISLFHCWAGNRTAWVDEKIAIFEANNPHISVIPVVSTTCSQGFAERFITSIAAGSPFDVAMITPETLVSLASQGMLAPLDSYMSRQGLDSSIWFPSEIRSAQWENHTYGLPLTTGGDDSSILIYNRQLFEEAGLDPDRPPTTFDELWEVSRSLTRFNGEEIVLAPFDFVDEGTYGPLSWVYAGGGQVVSDDGLTATYHEGKAVETMEYLRSYIQVHLGGPRNIIGGREQAFQRNRVAMVGRGSGRYGEVRAYIPDFPVGVGLRPRAADSPWIGGSRGGWFYAMPSATPHPNEAWLLIYWLTVPEETAGYFNLRQGRPSPIITYNHNRDYLDINPYFGIIAEALASVASVPVRPGFQQFHNEFRATWVKLLRDHSIDARAALEDSARIATSILKEANW